MNVIMEIKIFLLKMRSNNIKWNYLTKLINSLPRPNIFQNWSQAILYSYNNTSEYSMYRITILEHQINLIEMKCRK